MLERGSLEERILIRSVLKHIKKQSDGLAAGAVIGQDFGAFTTETGGTVISADGMSHDPKLAWIKAANNFACSGSRPQGARLTLMLPQETAEQDIKTFMQVFCRCAEEEHIHILGGHTQADAVFSEPRFLVTMVGASCTEGLRVQDVTEGDSIVMVRPTGLLGMRLITEAGDTRLQTRFAESYIREMYVQDSDLRVDGLAYLAAEYGACCMHDVSCGGLYAALEQLSVRLNRGILIRHENILIRQETIELCEFYNINPYMLEGCGTLLIVAKDGEAMADAMKDTGAEAAVIGHMTADRDRRIVIGDAETRYLSLVAGDEIYKVLPTPIRGKR